MRWLAISFIWVSLMGAWAYSIHQTARMWQSEMGFFQNIFKPSYPCVQISTKVLQRYEQVNPAVAGYRTDSLKAVLLYDLLDCIGYIDDFGADVKKVQVRDSLHTLEWRSGKAGGYFISVTYKRSDSCVVIEDIDGLTEMLQDTCIADSKKFKAGQIILP